MKLQDEPEDGLWMFADVMCGTLGIVMLLALFFVLQAAGGAGGLRIAKDAALPTALLVERQLIARERLAAAETPGAAAAPLPPPSADALRRVELDLLSAAADRMSAVYGERIRRAREEFLRAHSASFRLPREGATPPRNWFYLIVRGGEVHPLHTLRNGAVRPDTESNSLLIFSQGVRQRFLPRPGHAWPGGEARERLAVLARQLQGVADCQLVLLVHPDSFALGRDLVRTLDGTGTAHSWMPLLQDDAVELSREGYIPPGARR